MSNKNKIALAISKIKNIDHIKRGEEMLITARPYAQDYINSYKEICTTEDTIKKPTTLEEYSKADQEIREKVSPLPFFDWLNDQNGFLKITENFHNQIKMVLKARTAFKIADAICYCAGAIPVIPQAIVVPKKWKQFVHKDIEHLILMSRNFELQAEEDLFLLLVKKLQNSPGSVYNSGKRHEQQTRELFIKQIMRQLLPLPWIKNNTDTSIADLSMGIISIFFNEMSRSDAITLVKSVRENVEKETSFLQNTVQDLINNQDY